MASYKELKGINVQFLDSDPTAVEGEVWYNSSANVIKIYAASGAWSSGGNMNTARGFHGMGGQGTQTAAFGFGGTVSPIQQAEQYDGSSWTEVADLTTGRSAGGGCGTQAAALYAGGYIAPATDASEEYDGTNWAEGNNLNNSREGLAGAGSQTAGLIFGVSGHTEE